jgi:hypothetical protein
MPHSILKDLTVRSDSSMSSEAVKVLSKTTKKLQAIDYFALFQNTFTASSANRPYSVLVHIRRGIFILVNMYLTRLCRIASA